MFAHYILILWLAGGQWISADANREIVAMSIYYGVNPHVALAVARIETGNVPEDRKDSAVSKTGDVGRFQINKKTWCQKHRIGLTGKECEQWLQVRSNNIKLGVSILARLQKKYANTDRSLTSCQCNGHHSGGWISHYNGGVVVQPDTRAERYGVRVGKYARQSRGLQW